MGVGDMWKKGNIKYMYLMLAMHYVYIWKYIYIKCVVYSGISAECGKKRSLRFYILGNFTYKYICT